MGYWIRIAAATVALTAATAGAASEPWRTGTAYGAGAIAEGTTTAGHDVAVPGWSWRGRIEPGKRIEIKGVNGRIRAEPASGDEVEVRALRKGKRSDPTSVRIEVVEHSDGVTICAVYPSRDPDRPNECRPGTAGRMNVGRNDVQVDFTVRVPAGVRFVGRNVNGSVTAEGLEGDVEAHTVNGSVDIATSGVATAATVNGSITASLGKARWEGTLEFSTVNGSITLEFPADLSCDIRVSVVNGRISSEFPLTVEGRITPRRLKGTIGSGGGTLVVKTVNGGVEIRRA